MEETYGRFNKASILAEECKHRAKCAVFWNSTKFLGNWSYKGTSQESGMNNNLNVWPLISLNSLLPWSLGMTSGILTNLEWFSFSFSYNNTKKKISSWPWNYLHRDKWDSDDTAMDLLSKLTFAQPHCDQTGHRKRKPAGSRSAV